MSTPEPRPADAPRPPPKSDPLTDLALTLPIFVLYHLGVVLLPVRNAADPVTAELRALASHSLLLYAGLTLSIGAAFVVVLGILGRGHALETRRFALVAFEGALYAVLMRFVGAYAVGSLRLGPPGGTGVFTGVVMSMGAGFYEEVVFRVGLFGLGALAIKVVFGKGLQGIFFMMGWAVLAAAVFAGWHYVGPLGDPWDLRSFVFRMVCGLVLTAIYVFRGFAPAVWTHALYDVWVMVLH
ncbi:CPBP family glutamic-type intramembrane protease [Chondromyces apiculatus]|uniref:CAAX amino terminal protease family n=1 Tax=Chondromyces apiculatus DSM 436 TaxID=1192034 RepID=A0A017TCN0_9BACT|nr:CPBP family glutamic-type intramembrane protease [Chondromyces apiculatus]EYF06540.1 CAAX amino terminal protease family [Chondromyces apiculatus DSM 436]